MRWGCYHLVQRIACALRRAPAAHTVRAVACAPPRASLGGPPGRRALGPPVDLASGGGALAVRFRLRFWLLGAGGARLLNTEQPVMARPISVSSAAHGLVAGRPGSNPWGAGTQAKFTAQGRPLQRACFQAPPLTRPIRWAWVWRRSRQRGSKGGAGGNEGKRGRGPTDEERVAPVSAADPDNAVLKLVADVAHVRAVEVSVAVGQSSGKGVKREEDALLYRVDRDASETAERKQVKGAGVGGAPVGRRWRDRGGSVRARDRGVRQHWRHRRSA